MDFISQYSKLGRGFNFTTGNDILSNESWAAFGFFKNLAAKTGMSPEDGALPQIRAALDPHAKSGEFYAPRFVTTGSPVKRPILRTNNQRNIAKLWELSEKETGISIEP